MYLTDEDMLRALQASASNLTISPSTGHSGLIFVKDNVMHTAGFELDRLDNSIVRSIEQYRAVFAAAGLEILYEGKSPFCEACYDLYLWVLRIQHNQ